MSTDNLDAFPSAGPSDTSSALNEVINETVTPSALAMTGSQLSPNSSGFLNDGITDPATALTTTAQFAPSLPSPAARQLQQLQQQMSQQQQQNQLQQMQQAQLYQQQMQQAQYAAVGYTGYRPQIDFSSTGKVHNPNMMGYGGVYGQQYPTGYPYPFNTANNTNAGNLTNGNGAAMGPMSPNKPPFGQSYSTGVGGTPNYNAYAGYNANHAAMSRANSGHMSPQMGGYPSYATNNNNNSNNNSNAFASGATVMGGGYLQPNVMNVDAENKKVTINLERMASLQQNRERLQQKGKVTLMARVFGDKDMAYGGGFANTAQVQGRPAPQRSNSASYTRRRVDQRQNNSRNNNNARGSNRRKESYREDSYDDDFIDDRDAEEIDEQRSDLSGYSDDDLAIREAEAMTTRKRRKDYGLTLYTDEVEINTNSGDKGYTGSIMPPADWDESSNKRLTRSYISTTERKKFRYKRDSDEEDEDSDEDEEQEKIISEMTEEEDESLEGENGARSKVSQLQKLMDLCEHKVELMTDFLAQNGLEYEKLKNTALALTLPLAEPQPATLTEDCTLTRYQLVGVNWLYLLFREKVNGILADEMGLGKTLQTIALFTLLKEKEVDEGPHLVVVPSTTLAQWANEIKRWSPNLRTMTYYGTPNERKAIRQQCRANGDDQDFDILLTTYQLIGGKEDKKLFKIIPWHYMILDEAQNIKNGQSLRFQSLFKIKSKMKLLLTGTPLQNNLRELWALLHFLMSEDFEKLNLANYTTVFREFIKSNKDDKQTKKRKITEQDEYIQRLKRILEPFLLRRLKLEVTCDLPAKIHSKAVVEMTETQLNLYSQIYAHSKTLWAEKQMKNELIKQGKERDPKNAKTVSLHNFLNNLLMQLRKVSNHPLLLRVYYDDSMLRQIAQILVLNDPAYKKDQLNDIVVELSSASDWEIHEICYARQITIPLLKPFLLTDDQVFQISGKMNKLKELLVELKQAGHRVLIFSQMTKMMNILGCFFDREGHSFVRLDGSTPVSDRQKLIDQYNSNPEIFIFLLSTRAGGLGINLSTADTVIFYDIAFNPQVDRQAEDRCHRIGQKRQVNVITLLTADSCEEQIWEMAHEKKELNDIMLEEGEYSRKPEEEDGNADGEYIFEEKEEELGSDRAMQVVLTHLFEEPQTNGKSTKKDKKSSSKSKSSKSSSKSKKSKKSDEDTGKKKRTRSSSKKDSEWEETPTKKSTAKSASKKSSAKEKEVEEVKEVKKEAVRRRLVVVPPTRPAQEEAMPEPEEPPKKKTKLTIINPKSQIVHFNRKVEEKSVSAEDDFEEESAERSEAMNYDDMDG